MNKCINCNISTDNATFCSKECWRDFSFSKHKNAKQRKVYMESYQITVEEINIQDKYLSK